MSATTEAVRRLIAAGVVPAAFARHFGVSPPSSAPSRRPLPCVHEGPVAGWCHAADDRYKVRRCDHPAAEWDWCAREATPREDGRDCRACRLYAAPVPAPGPPIAPGLVARFDHRSLWPSVPGMRFNPSILADGDGYLFAARNGWRGSDIYVGRLDAAFRPVGEPARLALRHRDANYGREDPRLFWHAGKPHLSFIGVVGGRRIRHTNQLFARLSRDGRRVEDVFHPRYPGRRLWEKNWQLFDHNNDLYAVYSIAPHRVLRVRSNDAELAFEAPFPAPWRGGELRGGAAPVRVGDEWYSFFHDRVELGGHRVYRTGLYCFSARPPFQPTRYIPEPILTADTATKPADQYASVVFAGGAVRAGDSWVVAHGVHDRYSELHAFDAADLERRLVPVRPPGWVAAGPELPCHVWTPHGGGVNVGDWLTVPIVRALGREPAPPVTGGACLFAVGTTLHPDHYRASGAGRVVVWGAGSGDGDPRADLLDVRAVRGPRTAAALGLPAGVPLGDPALLLPRLVPTLPPADSCHVLYVRHCGTPADVRPDWADAHTSMRAPEAGALGVVAAIAAAGFVVTESLHGAIVAHAYGVPWAPAPGRPLGAKWADWLAYLGLPIDSRPAGDGLAGARGWWAAVGRHGRGRDLGPLLAAFPGG